MILDSFNIFIFDLDGCLWEEGQAIGNSPHVLKKLQNSGKTIIFISNNSTRTIEEYQTKIHSVLQYSATADQIISSATATAIYCRTKKYSRIFLIGEEGIRQALSSAGIMTSEQVNSDFNGFDAVIVGMDRSFTYQKLEMAQNIIINGAKFIATNPDPDFPRGLRVAPGAGSLIAAVSAAVGREPDIIIGKPNRYIIELALKQLSVNETEKVLVVGDRLITDVQAANNAGLKSLLVLTGRGREDLKKYGHNITPTFILDSVANIFD